MGIGPHGHVGTWVYGQMGIWAYGHMGIWAHWHMVSFYVGEQVENSLFTWPNGEYWLQASQWWAHGRMGVPMEIPSYRSIDRKYCIREAQ